jgi:hypothetical protein
MSSIIMILLGPFFNFSISVYCGTFGLLSLLEEIRIVTKDLNPLTIIKYWTKSLMIYYNNINWSKKQIMKHFSVLF